MRAGRSFRVEIPSYVLGTLMLAACSSQATSETPEPVQSVSSSAGMPTGTSLPSSSVAQTASASSGALSAATDSGTSATAADGAAPPALSSDAGPDLPDAAASSSSVHSDASFDGGSSGDAGPVPEADARVESSCEAPIALQCGDRFDHSTLREGRANTFSLYGCTPRAEGGRETIYLLQTERACSVDVRLTNLTEDLDLVRLPSVCEGIRATGCSSTPLDLQDDEHLAFTTSANELTWIVVDGYLESAGSYTLEATCTCTE